MCDTCTDVIKSLNQLQLYGNCCTSSLSEDMLPECLSPPSTVSYPLFESSDSNVSLLSLKGGYKQHVYSSSSQQQQSKDLALSKSKIESSRHRYYQRQASFFDSSASGYLSTKSNSSTILEYEEYEGNNDSDEGGYNTRFASNRESEDEGGDLLVGAVKEGIMIGDTTTTTATSKTTTRPRSRCSSFSPPDFTKLTLNSLNLNNGDDFYVHRFHKSQEDIPTDLSSGGKDVKTLFSDYRLKTNKSCISRHSDDKTNLAQLDDNTRSVSSTFSTDVEESNVNTGDHDEQLPSGNSLYNATRRISWDLPYLSAISKWVDLSCVSGPTTLVSPPSLLLQQSSCFKQGSLLKWEDFNDIRWEQSEKNKLNLR